MKYNFYNYLILNLHTNGHNGYKKYFDNEYKRIVENTEGHKADKQLPTIDLKIVSKLPEYSENDIYRSIKYKNLFNYQFVVKGVNTRSVEIYFLSHFVDKIYMNAIGVFLQAQVLEPIMYYKLLENNVLFMHASGVSKSGRGYLFPAHGGTGKTTFCIALMKQGYKLLGDDLLFVAIDSGKVYPYQRPLHIFTYNIRNLDGSNIPFKYKLAIYTKNFIRFFLEKILKVEFLISTRIHADEIFSENPFGSTSEYKGIFFLRKSGPSTQTIYIRSDNVSSIVEEIMISEDLNDSLYEIIGDSSAHSIKELEHRVIKLLLKQFDSITYVNTRKLDLNDLNEFVNKFMEYEK